jgi:hypothetical protein
LGSYFITCCILSNLNDDERKQNPTNLKDSLLNKGFWWRNPVFFP